MSKLQRKAIQDQTLPQDVTASMPRSPKPVSVGADTHAEVASPARDLMAHLNFELTSELSANEVEAEKYPLKWTVIGLTLFCGLSWYGLLSLIL
jgi:hypothetical protein